jgi:hypothetical protein
LTFDPAEFVQSLDERGGPWLLSQRRIGAQKADVGRFAICCARATSAHDAVPPRAAMNPRLFIR